MIEFRETQRFTQWWLWVLVLASSAATGFGIYSVVALEPGSGSGASPGVLILMVLVGVGVPVLLAVSRLDVEVRPDALYLRFVPFHRRWRRWRYDEIVRADARKYRPILEYGGWGLRFSRAGIAYNVTGDLGVQLVMRSGKRILIGSRNPEALAAAIRERMPKPEPSRRGPS